MLIEILNEDGTMARRPDLEAFAAQHDMKISTIAALIRYRMQNEKTVERVADTTADHRVRSVPGIDLSGRDQPAGAFRSGQGDIDPEQPVLVRVHVQNFLSDLLAIRLSENSCCPCAMPCGGWQRNRPACWCF